MTTSIVDLNGLDLRSSPLFQTDCATPILNWIKHCPPDDVVRNMPIVVGMWNTNTTAPGITDVQVDIDTTGIVDPNCDTAVVTTTLDGCEFVLPNMKDIALGTNNLKIKDWKDKFCRPRKIAPDRFCLFNRDGTLNDGEELAVDFAGMALTTLKMALAQLITKSAMVGDEANAYEFDGLYNQIDNGWAAGSFATCDASINVGVTINWDSLTGGPGTGTASPDDVTTAQDITIWGDTCSVPAGLNLAQFLDDIWFPKVFAEWTDRHGGVDSWEMHVKHGQGKCFLNTAACIQPCATCGSTTPGSFQDTELRQRFQDIRRSGVAELYPSGTLIPVRETKHVADNTIRIGPRSIGGYPTYVLFFQSIAEMLPEFPGSEYGTGFGYDTSDAQIPVLTEDVVDFPLESETLYWALTRTNIQCFKAEMLACAGLLACWRHLWLKITNVTCCSCVGDCADNVTITNA